MRVLFDHNVDRRFRKHLVGHAVRTTREMRWETLGNGVLLRSAADAGFDAILCIDKNIEHEQNLQKLPLPVIVLDAYTNAVHGLLPFTPFLLNLLDSRLQNRLYFIEKDGKVVVVEAKRPKR